MKIGIYSGTFNPIHCGHIALADFILEQKIVDEIWMIRTPQNPFKSNSSLLSDEHRAAMLAIAVAGHNGLKISNVEDDMPKPNYTINTLRKVKELYPENDFYLIIGADNWKVFDKWYKWETILSDFHLIVYPRPGYEIESFDCEQFPTVKVIDAPMYNLSSTEIREKIEAGEYPENLIPQGVLNYIIENKLYGNN
ncbi:MAG: nicotinate-nucleotide adenylyltransferase [Bacteroidales bacterium]|nr:nicotinate-nucleotide adenylyltransferase [Bacteroidales bacterium]